jgi:quercetin dioxygenase-like cupin family protein
MGARLVSLAFWTDLEAIAASSITQEGVLWILDASDDLNANLVRFGTGRGVGEHVNDEVDVVFLGVSGSGFVGVNGEEHTLSAGKLIFVPKDAWRSTRSTSEDFAYLTIHRRRGPLQIGR